MIIPQPEADLSNNAIVVGADLLDILRKKENYVIVDDLLETFLKRGKTRSTNLFFNTIVLLYSLGLIEEHNYKIRVSYDNT
jgi:hypothetical protein